MSTYPSDVLCKHKNGQGMCDACDAEHEDAYNQYIECGGDPEQLL